MATNLWSGHWNGRTPVGDDHRRARQVISPSGGIMRGKFPSRKNGRLVHHEGLLELDAIYLLEASPQVVRYREQPTTITYPDGGRLRRYTPDLEVTLQSGASIWVEVKPAVFLAREDIRHKLQCVAAHLKRSGQAFVVLTDEVLRQPRFKGTIERYLKTINYHFAHQLPGASFARFHQRGDYDPQKCALMTLGEFKHLFEKWVVDVYAQTVHKSIGTTPWQRWHEGLAAHEPHLPADLSVLQQRIGQSASRKLRRDGFELNGIRYNGDVLAPILRKFGEGVEIRVVYDPEDLGSVHVWGPDDTEPKAVQALELGYARGMTKQQNGLIRQLLREEGAKVEDRVALQRARNDMAKAVEELMVSRKQKARQRSAHLRGFSSSKPSGSPPQPQRVPNAPVRRPVPSIKPADKAPSVPPDLPRILTAFQMGSSKRGGDGNS